MAMKIARIKPNINDKTIRLNTAVIHTMAADFDGDKINRDFSPMKDEAIGLYLFLHD